MPVVGKDLGQSFLAHRLHGDAIREAIAFIGPRSVESHAGEKRFPTLRNDLDARVFEDALDVVTALRRIASGAIAKKVRYSANTSSVVTMGESARAEARAKARWWALSVKSTRAIQ